MGMELMARYSVRPDRRPDLAFGADLIDRRWPGDRVEVRIAHADGTQDVVALPQSAVDMIGTVLREAAASGEVAILAEAAEISPEDAASILGISRPLVRRRMDAGILRFRRVGTHRRVRLTDVLELQRREAPVHAALEELRADTDELTANGL